MSNIAVDNADQISLRYGEITSALNKCFRSTDSKTANSLQVGSYGRWTAIKGISDLDMLYLMPASSWNTYKDGGQYDLLRDAADAIEARYPTTDVCVDRVVVQVLYKNFQVEVQPVFELDDGSFRYPDTYSGGSWKVTKPRDEMAAMAEFATEKNNNLRRLCRMVRAWKNKHGVAMGGLLIDTFAHSFLRSIKDYDEKSFLYYDYMVRDFFDYLADRPDQDYFAALGSGQRVKVKKRFQRKARAAHALCRDAIAADEESARNEKWRKVFGKGFPGAIVVAKRAYIEEGAYKADNTEQFVEELFPVDVRYPLTIDCEVTQRGFRTFMLRSMLLGKLPLVTHKSLRFFVKEHGIPGKFKLYWKVLNRGSLAIRRNCIRGQIVEDLGSLERIESTNFLGNHQVEAYATKNGVVVATDRIRVPIAGEGEE